MYYVVRIKVHVPGYMWSRFSTYFMVICFQLPITRTPDNSNLFRFPLKVRVIVSRLYISSRNLHPSFGKEDCVSSKSVCTGAMQPSMRDRNSKLLPRLTNVTQTDKRDVKSYQAYQITHSHSHLQRNSPQPT